MAAPLVPLILAPLLAWRFYSRFRGSVGRQPVRPRRMILRIVILAAAAVMITTPGLQHLPSLAGFGGGLLTGAVLGLIGLHFTRFEKTTEGGFYHPNARIGVALTLLLAGRIIYRMAELYISPPVAGHAPEPPLQSPLTFLFFGLLAGYYIAYLAGVLIRSRNTKISPVLPVQT